MGHTTSMTRRPYAIRLWSHGKLVAAAVVEACNLLEAYAWASELQQEYGAQWWIVGELHAIVDVIRREGRHETMAQVA